MIKMVAGIALFALFSLPGVAQKGPVDLWTTGSDPFTDAVKVMLGGMGKAEKLELRASCQGIDPNRYGLSFKFLSLSLRPGNLDSSNGSGRFRFDNGPVETFHFQGMFYLPMLGFDNKFDNIYGQTVTTDEGDALTKRLSHHDRLRIEIWSEENGLPQRIVEDFDISEVNEETLEVLCMCEKDPETCTKKSN